MELLILGLVIGAGGAIGGKRLLKGAAKVGLQAREALRGAAESVQGAVSEAQAEHAAEKSEREAGNLASG